MKEEEILRDFISRKNLKQSGQRQRIFKVFLSSRKHLTADNLYRQVKKIFPGIGIATVYRSLKLFCESGLCRELKGEDGTARYELQYGHEHHDHLICIRCGRFIEVVHPMIEKLQEEIARKEGFRLVRHRLELYGLCPACRKGK
jgi:Fur family ferric uptake transcriptional regulator